MLYIPVCCNIYLLTNFNSITVIEAESTIIVWFKSLLLTDEDRNKILKILSELPDEVDVNQRQELETFFREKFNLAEEGFRPLLELEIRQFLLNSYGTTQTISHDNENVNNLFFPIIYENRINNLCFVSQKKTNKLIRNFFG